mgnify:CR=1 FL=1
MPFAGYAIAPALKILAENVSILSAAGGAVEDLQRPDAEELEDTQARAGEGDVTSVGETDPPVDPLTYLPTPPIPRSARHLFRYFIDGSLRTYFIATGVQHNRTFPIELAQIGSACVFRRDDGSIKTHNRRRKILLLVPKGAEGLSEDVWDCLQAALPPSGEIELRDTSQHDRGDRRTDARTHAGGIARRAMHDLEVEIIDSSLEGDPPRSDSAWAILDGGIRLGEFIDKPHVLAAAKSFDKSVRFYFGRRPRERFDITRLLRDLPPAHRTAAFFADAQKQVVFWYVRLWDRVELDYPLMGVIKLEIGRPDRAPAETELINLLSSCIVAEKAVTPYGKDTRWHCHLYPIYCAEHAIKSNFLSQQTLLGQIRWPRPQGNT